MTLELEQLTLRWRDAPERVLVPPLTCRIPPEAPVTLMGPSGSGKSTLLAALCGTLPAAFTLSGTIQLQGRLLNPLPPEARRVGILFQEDLLFPHLSVGENLAFGLPRSVKGKARQQKVQEALAQIELPEAAQQDPATLSGGQRARVSLMRTLMAEPQALLLDEPFSKLDQALRARFREFVFAHAAARALPVLMVTHDPEDAAAAGGPVLHLSLPARPGS